MIQSIVAILTVPVTSYVCAKASVVFVQRCRSRLTLRQTMVLADWGWTSLDIYQKLVLKQFPKYGSSLLIIAVVLNLLGMSKGLQDHILEANVLKAA